MLGGSYQVLQPLRVFFTDVDFCIAVNGEKCLLVPINFFLRGGEQEPVQQLAKKTKSWSSSS